MVRSFPHFIAASQFCVRGPNEGVRFESYGNSFDNLVDAATPVKLITDEAVFSEGPVCLKDGSLCFSELQRNRVASWTEEDGVNPFRSPSHFQNGNTLDLQGRLIGASHGERAIVRREFDGNWVTLVDHYAGNRLNGPDDLVVSSDGKIFFTDPPYGLILPDQGYGGQQEQEGNYCYRYDPDTDEILRLSTPEIATPNGLAFSPDESILYVTDTNHSSTTLEFTRSNIYAYEVSDGVLKNGKLFAHIYPGIPDGLKVDELGNVWSSSEEGIHIFSPSAELLGKILIDSRFATSNLAFCSDRSGGKWLYVAATSRVLRIGVKVRDATVKFRDAKVKFLPPPKKGLFQSLFGPLGFL